MLFEAFNSFTSSTRVARGIRKVQVSKEKERTETLYSYFIYVFRNYAVLIREIIAGWVLLPLMDVLADPNIINYITVLAITHKSKSTPHETHPQETVEFLHNFSSRIKKSSALTSDLKTIRKDTDLLYAFMQFLKRENAVHLLQFCLDVGKYLISI